MADGDYGTFICDTDDQSGDCIELGCYGGIPNCVVNQTQTCLSWTTDGCIDNTANCILSSADCLEGALIGLYPAGTEQADPVAFLSDYRSPLFTFGDMNAQCTFSSVEVLYEGELSIYAYIDSQDIVLKDNFQSKLPRTARLLIPNEQARGNFLQVRLVFNGAVYGYRVNGEPLYQYSK